METMESHGPAEGPLLWKRRLHAVMQRGRARVWKVYRSILKYAAHTLRNNNSDDSSQLQHIRHFSADNDFSWLHLINVYFVDNGIFHRRYFSTLITLRPLAFDLQSNALTRKRDMKREKRWHEESKFPPLAQQANSLKHVSTNLKRSA